MAIMLGTSVSGIITSCGDDDDGINYAGKGGSGNNDDDNSNASIGNSYAMRYEVPKIRKGKGIYFVYHEANVNNNSTQKTMDYCLEYDSAAFHSRWVAFSFDATTRAKNVNRSNTWAEDPKLPASCRLTTDYFQGHDRGHLCASYDRLFSTEANQKTFYMSNMSPQIGDFNANYWVVLEQLIQNWGRLGNYTNLYVCKGGTIDKDKNQVKRYISHDTANGRIVNVVVPKYYFAAVLAESANKTYQAIGFWMEHKNYGYSGDSYATASMMKEHAMSIDNLEKLTGIDFFCNLPNALENNVEASYSEGAWSWK